MIFDDRWGGQFTPVRNGTIYQEPTEQSIQAAKLCLEGVNVAKDSLYFLAPALTNNHWIMENRTHVMTIGAHWFTAERGGDTSGQLSGRVSFCYHL